MDMAANTSDSVALLSQTQIYTQERFITLAPSTTGEGGGRRSNGTEKAKMTLLKMQTPY